MKYQTSFRRTLRISRYLFRGFALMLWLLGALLTTFYIFNVLHTKESEMRQEFNFNLAQAQNYIKHTANIMRDVKHMFENKMYEDVARLDVIRSILSGKDYLPNVYSLHPGSDCSGMLRSSSVDAFAHVIQYWKDNFASAYDVNRIFIIGGETQCVADFGYQDDTHKNQFWQQTLNSKVEEYRNLKSKDRDANVYWIVPSKQINIGYLYVLTPIYNGNKLEALLGIEQVLRLDDFISNSTLPMNVTLLDQDNHPLIQLMEGNKYLYKLSHYPADYNYFGYVDNYSVLLMKKLLTPSGLSVVYSLPILSVIDNIRILLINSVLLNLFSGIVLFFLTWFLERKMFVPAESNAFQLEEHESFNRKIVASAPVGISILRLHDGANILSNELAHNYISLLDQDDRKKIKQIIGEKRTNLIDVITNNNKNLQISFVHSRYRNEDVAICVLVDVSSRVQMEESLQEIARVAEQASQSKSMFLATVSHELRTPLYGIIGNLELLRTHQLSDDTQHLVKAMSHSSALLLKIISDLLDFSKIESEQLTIDDNLFSCIDIVEHISANYLPLVIKKHLHFYCFIDPETPLKLMGDSVRLQQVIANLLNNAIKFTHSGCIVLDISSEQGYLLIKIRDTGVGINANAMPRLFDPFYQVNSGMQVQFQGTGLGLAICDKLVHLMDGDISVSSEPMMGTIFTVRLPLYSAEFAPIPTAIWQGKHLYLAIHNTRLFNYLHMYLARYGAKLHNYEGEHLAPDDLLLSDHDDNDLSLCYRVIRFSTEHVGAAQEKQKGYWLQSTAFVHRVAELIQQIYRTAGENIDPVGSLDNLSFGLSSTQISSNEKLFDSTYLEEYTTNKQCNLLVVDDHPINRKLLSDQLNALGYHAKTACDGIDALRILETEDIHLILTDVNMPRMDGYQLTQHLRKTHFSRTIIGVTANALAEEKQRCLQAGMDGCLSKPVTLERLASILKDYCG